MKNALFTAAAAAAVAAPAMASLDTWTPPGHGDVRGPCPMLNTLSNHGFLPHSGKDFDLKAVTDGLHDALHIDPDLSAILFQFALTTNPAPNATTFSLSDLGRHGILEHDGSLSRKDFFFADPTVFDAETFAETTSYWTDEQVTIKMAADARMARLATSLNTNPQFALSGLGAAFDAGESAAYIAVFGDGESMSAPRDYLLYFFQNERLPSELGWKVGDKSFDEDGLEEFMVKISEATYGNLTAPNPDAQPQSDAGSDSNSARRRRDFVAMNRRGVRPSMAGRFRMH
jgi:hypothetical protein